MIYIDLSIGGNMPQIIENDDIPGIQRLIHRLAAAEGISLYELAERSGLHPTTLYAILKKKPGPHRRPIRRETITALAEGSRFTVTFDAVKGRVVLERSGETAPVNDVDELMEEIRRVLVRSHRRKFTPEQKRTIVRVLSALVSD
jgi:transcriptional regulator with XRE-family HTH domain